MSAGEVDTAPDRTVESDETDGYAHDVSRAKRPHRLALRAAERCRARMRRNKVLNTTWRVFVFVIGIVVILAGVVMLVTPGPGWLAIVAGFAILASEFMWARHALRKAKGVAIAAKEKALDPRVRRRNQLLLLAASMVLVACCAMYLGVFGMTLPWNADIVNRLP